MRPDSLSVFYGADCLSLEKLPLGSKWTDVERAVLPVDFRDGPGLAVRGKWLRRRIPIFSSRGAVGV